MDNNTFFQLAILCIFCKLICCQIGVCGKKSDGIKCCTDYRKENGVCTICPKGWYGYECNSPCPKGSYGHACRHRCKCQHCDPVDGCVIHTKQGSTADDLTTTHTSEFMSVTYTQAPDTAPEGQKIKIPMEFVGIGSVLVFLLFCVTLLCFRHRKLTSSGNTNESVKDTNRRRRSNTGHSINSARRTSMNYDSEEYHNNAGVSNKKDIDVMEAIEQYPNRRLCNDVQPGKPYDNESTSSDSQSSYSLPICDATRSRFKLEENDSTYMEIDRFLTDESSRQYLTIGGAYSITPQNYQYDENNSEIRMQTFTIAEVYPTEKMDDKNENMENNPYQALNPECCNPEPQ